MTSPTPSDIGAPPTLVCLNPLPPAQRAATGDLPVLDCQPVYASAHNFTGKLLYNRLETYLLDQAAKALFRAAAMAAADGFTLGVFDAYRPLELQYAFWSILPDPAYVADPRLGSTHGRGIAVDLTLLDDRHMPLEMGTGYDEFSPASHHDHTDLPDEALANRRRLRGYMEQAGFVIHAPEWWHYNLPDPERFPLIPDGLAAPALLRPEIRQLADQARQELCGQEST